MLTRLHFALPRCTSALPSSSRLTLTATARPLSSRTATIPHHKHTPSKDTGAMTKGNETHELLVKGDKVLERTESGTVVAEKDYDHVIRGYKAAEHNPRFSEETHKNAEHIRHDLEAAHEAEAGSPKHGKSEAGTHHGKAEHPSDTAHKGESHEDEVHRHRVIAGLKANLHRDDRSEETKEHIRQQLRELGEPTD